MFYVTVYCKQGLFRIIRKFKKISSPRGSDLFHLNRVVPFREQKLYILLGEVSKNGRFVAQNRRKSGIKICTINLIDVLVNGPIVNVMLVLAVSSFVKFAFGRI